MIKDIVNLTWFLLTSALFILAIKDNSNGLILLISLIVIIIFTFLFNKEKIRKENLYNLIAILVGLNIAYFLEVSNNLFAYAFILFLILTIIKTIFFIIEESKKKRA